MAVENGLKIEPSQNQQDNEVVMCSKFDHYDKFDPETKKSFDELRQRYQEEGLIYCDSVRLPLK